MTDKISNEAISLRNALAELYRPQDWANSEWQPVFLAGDALLQSALTAARNQALEDAARYIEQDGLQQSLAEAEAIRAMKVQP